MQCNHVVYDNTDPAVLLKVIGGMVGKHISKRYEMFNLVHITDVTGFFIG